jgi:hypothetical protein
LPTPDDDYYMYAVRAKVEAAGGAVDSNFFFYPYF